MTSKPLYQPWSHEEFNADRRVRNMGSAARKCYAMLLHEAFFCSTRPYLPDNDDELWTLADCESLEEWNAVRDRVRPMFSVVVIEGARLLKNKRVCDDWDVVQAIRKKNQKNALARWNNDQPAPENEPKDDATAMRSHAIAMPNAIWQCNEVSKEVSNKEVSKEESIVDDALDGATGHSLSLKVENLKDPVQEGWVYFLAKTGKSPSQYQFSRERQQQGLKGFESLVAFAKRGGSEDPLDAAAGLFRLAVDRLTDSPFHNGKNDQGRSYLDWHQLFRGKDYPPPSKLLEYWLDDSRWAK